MTAISEKTTGKRSIYQVSPDELAAWLSERGQPAYRVRQILEWVYKHRVPRFSEMSSLPKDLRQQLEESFDIGGLPVVRKFEGRDSVKLLLRLDDGETVECVSIAVRWGRTLCLSCQVGCPIGCAFCASGAAGLVRNLTAEEMIRQIISLEQAAGPATNVVFMGMGEPLLNYEAVMEAIEIITSKERMGIAPRRVTVGTAGIVPMIRKFAEDAPRRVELAVSLNAPTDKLRKRLMPGVAKWSISELLAACDYFTEVRRGQPVTYAYVLIAGVNDSLEHADMLADLLAGRRHHINLIRMNPIERSDLRPASKDATIKFARHLEQLGLNVSIRRSRGQDVRAACGQLRLAATRNRTAGAP